MAIEILALESLIKQKFADADITIKALVDDGNHYSIEVASASFRGKTRIEQHRMVNNALEGILGTTLHALSIKTRGL